MTIWEWAGLMALLVFQLFLEFILMAGILNYVFKARLQEAVQIAAAEVKREFGAVKIDLKGPLRELCQDEDFQATVDELVVSIGDQLQARIEVVAQKYAGGGAPGETMGGAGLGGVVGKVLERFLGGA